jgi:hypothetical protein
MDKNISSAVEQPIGDLTDERAAFEAWARKTHRRPGASFDRAHDGTYKDNRIAAKWAAWNAAIAAHLARQPKAESTLSKICDMLHIGVLARDDGTILTSVRNILRREHCLSAIEREFFMVASEPDEDFPDDDPGEDCLLNWGSEPADYVEQFRAAIAQKSASPASQEDAYLARQAQAETTDIARRLRQKATQPFGPEDFSLLTLAADECDRFYNGMMNWKANAQAKDRNIIELREKLAKVAPAGAQNALPDLVNRFLGWPMPDSLSARIAPNVTKPIGTHLMNADEARAMFAYCLSAGAQNAEAIRNQAEADALLKCVEKSLAQCYVGVGPVDDPDPDSITHNNGVRACIETVRSLQTGSANTQEGGAA